MDPAGQPGCRGMFTVFDDLDSDASHLFDRPMTRSCEVARSSALAFDAIDLFPCRVIDSIGRNSSPAVRVCERRRLPRKSMSCLFHCVCLTAILMERVIRV